MQTILVDCWRHVGNTNPLNIEPRRHRKSDAETESASGRREAGRRGVHEQAVDSKARGRVRNGRGAKLRRLRRQADGSRGSRPMRWRLRPQGRRVPFGGAKRRQDRRQVRRPGRRQAAAQEAAGASGRRPGRRRDERATAPRARRGGSVGTGAALRRPGAAAAAVRILAARAAGAGPVRGGVPLHRPDRGAPRR